MPTNLVKRDGQSRTNYKEATRTPSATMRAEGVSPFLECPWDPEWNDAFDNWSMAYKTGPDIDELIRNADGEDFHLSLKQRNGRYTASMINQLVEDGVGPKILVAHANHPVEAILLLYYKWHEVFERKWPKEQEPKARAARG